MTIIASLLRAAELPDSPTARLDAELLLAAALGKSRSYLHTWPEKIVSSEAALTFAEYLLRRRTGEPVAYILGQQGFWNLDLEVAPHTLIPRPDTELLVETALALLPATPAKVLDLGTGSGAIALALASERAAWHVTAVDRVLEAVALAERNRQRLKQLLRFLKAHVSDLERADVYCSEANERQRDGTDYVANRLEVAYQVERVLDESGISKGEAFVKELGRNRTFHDRELTFVAVDQSGCTSTHRYFLTGGIDYLLDERSDTRVFHAVVSN